MLLYLLGALILILGFIYKLFPAKTINIYYGYRTKLSKKNQDTWNQAQKICGFSLMGLGLFYIIVELLISKFMDTLSIDGQSIILVVGAAVMIFLDETYMRSTFNRDGTRK